MSTRLRSLDVLRGATVALMILVNNPGSWHHLLDSTSARVHPAPETAPAVQGPLTVQRPGVHVLVQTLQGGPHPHRHTP